MNKSDFKDITSRIEELISSWELKLLQLSNEDVTSKRNSQNRTIKEILGHMIDAASNNHQRIVRLQYNKELDFPDYRQDNDAWLSIQKYNEEDWNLMLKLWKYFNLHLAHLFLNIDINSLENRWSDYESTSISLREMIESYLVHLELHLLEISDLMDTKTSGK